MRIGIYGGTFNPIHRGHLTAARPAFELLKLDKLYLIPAAVPPHKPLPPGSPDAAERLELTRLAGEQLGLGDQVETLDIELRREGKSYTSDTLAELHARHPEDELWLLMGTDMFLTLHAWHKPEAIFAHAGVAAFGRTEEDIEPLFAAQRERLYREYPDARLFTMTVPGVIDISSTELRALLRQGTGGRCLAPAVYGQILRDGGYETGADLKHLPLRELRPVALSYLKHKRIPHVLGTEQEAIRLALRYVAMSGEVWCEGARIFLDPPSSYFSPQHARIALNFAAFFTPQYGDVFIEVAVAPPTHAQGIRLHMIVSDALFVGRRLHPLQLTSLLAAVPSLPLFIRNASLFNPNYGPLWNRCAASSICTPNEVGVIVSYDALGAAVCSRRMCQERGD